MLGLSLLLGICLLAIYAIVFVATAWRFAVRRGPRSLVVVWLAGAALFWLLNITKLWMQGMTVHFPPTTLPDRLAIFGFLGFALCGTGLATLSVRRRLRTSPDGRLTIANTAAGVGAFFAGMVLTLIVVAINDISGVILSHIR